jgi:hypothetical protein
MSETRRSASKVPQALDKQAPGNSHTQAGRREHHRRDHEAAEVDEQGIFAEDPTATLARTTAMDTFNYEALKELLADTTRLCISIHMQTRPTAELVQNRAEFKNLLRDAERQLVALGMDLPEATELLVPAWELLENMPFWQSATEGLALFRSPDLFRVYRAIQPPTDMCLVNDRFEIQPLLPLLNGEGRFYVLTLSQDDIRLLRGNRERIEEVPLEGVPRNMADALNEEPERHAFNRNNAFGAGQQFHGHSQAPEDTVDRLNRFFHMVDKGLHRYFKNETAPLVLTGVEYLFPIYRSANTYQHLVEEGIHGNPKQYSAQELHEKAWPIVQPFFLKTQEAAIERYNEAKAMPDLISQSLEEIVSAAAFGRVDTLFTAIGAQTFGTFDAAANEVHQHDTREAGDDDLINFAAMQVLLHSGTVYALPPESMPDGEMIAALYRF